MKNKTNSIAYKIIISALLFIVSGGSHATIYKCVNAKAEVYFNDKPCHWTQIERKVKAAKDPVGGYLPPGFVSEEVKSSSTGVFVGESERKVDESEADTKKPEHTNNSTYGSNNNQANNTVYDDAAQGLNSNNSVNASSDSQEGSGSKHRLKLNVLMTEPLGL